MTKQHVVFAGGGTAGHLFPGLAVAEELRRLAPSLRITFLGSGRSFERKHVLAAGWEHAGLPCHPLPKNAREAIRFIADNFTGYYAARWFLREQAVSLVVGLGGYVSAPAVRAARQLGVPYVLLEQNVVPGRATRWGARGASRVCVAWNETRAFLRRAAVEVTGNPIARRIAQLPRQTFATGAAPRLLVLGGSGGSRTLNEQAPRAIYKTGAQLAGWEIVHQSGQKEVEATARLYAKLGLTARVTPFIDNMATMLMNVEIAISRAGGSALAEFAALGTPTILVPFPRAADNHQLRNAELFLARDACRLVVEREAGPRLDDTLAAEIGALAGDRSLRRRMGAAARRLACPNAALTVANVVLETAGVRAVAPPRARAA